MRFIPLLLLLIACSSKHIQRSATTTDSTHNQTTQVKAEDFNKSTATKTTTVSDQSGQRVVFETLPRGSSTKGEPISKQTTSSVGTGAIKADTARWIGNVFNDEAVRRHANTVTFENGRIKSAQGNILSAEATAVTDTHTEDSLYTENLMLKDSLSAARSESHETTKTVEKVVKRMPIWLAVLCLVVGIAGGLYLQYKYKPL